MFGDDVSTQTESSYKYLAAYQSTDNWCKMVQFDIKAEQGNCYFKPLEARYFKSTDDINGGSSCILSTREKIYPGWLTGTKTTVASSASAGGYGLQSFTYEICPATDASTASGVNDTCESKSIAASDPTKSVELGSCEYVTDIDIEQAQLQGSWFWPRNPTSGRFFTYSSSTDKIEYIMAHQSHDNWCKMIRFEITLDSTTKKCSYKPLNAKYKTSPLSNSICLTQNEVINNFNSPTGTTALATTASAGGYGIKTLYYEVCAIEKAAPTTNVAVIAEPATCASGLELAGSPSDYVSMGACKSASDFKPEKIKYQGSWIGNQMSHSIVASNDGTYITAYQSTDNWCKMINFSVKEENGQCMYKPISSGYARSPYSASTCTGEDQINAHWNSRNVANYALSNGESGYGINTLYYELCTSSSADEVALPTNGNLVLRLGCGSPFKSFVGDVVSPKEIGAKLVTKSMSEDFDFKNALEMTEVSCGVYEINAKPKAGEEFGFFVFPKDGSSYPAKDIGCKNVAGDKCPIQSIPAPLAGAKCAPEVDYGTGALFYNRVFDGETFDYVWGNCETSCSSAPIECSAASAKLGLSNEQQQETVSFLRPETSTTTVIVAAACMCVVAAAFFVSFRTKKEEEGRQKFVTGAKTSYGAV